MLAALDYGCLENELLDGLLEHHGCGTKQDLKVGRSWERKYVSRYNPCQETSPWIEKIRLVLDEFAKIARLTNEKSKHEKYKKLEEIIDHVRAASQEIDLNKNFESKDIEVPKLSSAHPAYPSLSSSVDVVRDYDKGRHVVANRDIAAGEIIAVSDPVATLLCPEKLEKLQNHCLHCHLFSKAPLPCENCCSVVFCSVNCRNIACQSYHKYECEMRLYELIPLEGKDMFGYFLALRAITQKPLEYFLEHREMLDIFIDQEEPLNIDEEVVYKDDDYRTLMNLVTHINDTQKSLSLKNSVIAVFFLRFLQHGKYFQHHVPERKTSDKTLHPAEQLILKILNHLIAVQCYNSQQVTELAVVKSQYKWETIGASLHPSLALVNHSCDANTFRFNMNQTSILIANRHISQGEEITMTYSGVDYKTMKLQQREYQLLKNYLFQCECRACVERWPLKDALPDELARIPNFEQERCFVVRHGDKKDICDEISGARWMADFGISSNTFTVAQEALDHLSVCLNKHVVKPHLHFVEATELAEMFAINQYCRMPLEITEEKEDQGEEVMDCDEEVGDYKIKSKENPKKSHANGESEDKLEGTNKLIKSFENSQVSNGNNNSSTREKSPTLRMFASLNEDDNGKGPRKKSVLDRIEDKIRPATEDSSFNKERSKRELADSMRRIPKKEEMADRLSAFQPKNLLPKSWISPVKEKTKDEKKIPEEPSEKPSVIEETKSVLKNVVETVKEAVSSAPSRSTKTDDEINDEVAKMIEAHRKKIRDERNKRKQNINNQVPLVISDKVEVLDQKDSECKREIYKREDKLNKMMESSNERERMLKERELEIQKLREKTRRMLEEARKKSEEFQTVEKSFISATDQNHNLIDPHVEKQSRRKKGGHKSSRAPEHKNKTADSHDADDDKDLLAFLRQSHKKKTNIYDFLSNPPPSSPGTHDQSSHDNLKLNPSSTQNLIDESMKQLESAAQSIKSISSGVQSMQSRQRRIHDAQSILPRRPHVEDRWEEMKKEEVKKQEEKQVNGHNKSPALTQPQPKHNHNIIGLNTTNNHQMNDHTTTVKPPVIETNDLDQILVNGKHWATQLEESIETLENKCSGQSDMSNEIVVNKSDERSETPLDTCDTRHYSQRWSEERFTLSPSPGKEFSRSPSRSPRLRKSTKLLKNQDSPPSRVADKPPRPGRLSRRKSLSDDCLIKKKHDTDAFGLPRISNKRERSVSLIRDSFTSKKDTKLDHVESEGRQRTISKETRTSNASEFKAKFETGSVSNLSIISRSASPYKPPKVDKTHLSKVKNKFSDENTKLPFPNYKPIPPKPKCKPPPPPL